MSLNLPDRPADLASESLLSFAQFNGGIVRFPDVRSDCSAEKPALVLEGQEREQCFEGE
jgi:hypothetical protein